MTVRRLVVPLLLSALTVLGVPQSAASAPPPAPPDPTCSPGPSNCAAWHNTNVTVSWSSPPGGVSASGCGNVTFTNDTGGTPITCTWSNSDGARSTTVNVRRDATPPSVSVSPERGPDANGWYNRAVTVRFSGSDATSGVSSCSSGAYSGPDTQKTSVSGSCTDNAGNTGSSSVEIKYDATPPSVEAKPERPPDANGWYNRAVKVAFVGADPVSGVDACVEPVTYKGPDTDKAALSGTCRDKASNTSQPRGFELKYDTTPPKLGRVRAQVGNSGVVLRWTASKDSLAFAVLRRPGLRGKKPSTVYQGRARAFTDRRLEAGVKYRYTVTAYDQARNAATRAVAAKALRSVAGPAPATRPRLTRPADGVRLTAPPLLAWTAVSGAAYYNVQLYRDGRKILTAWPGRPTFQLERSWRFGGLTRTLAPGRYRWYVWPGFGPRSAHRYGKLHVSRSFVVAGR